MVKQKLRVRLLLLLTSDRNDVLTLPVYVPMWLKILNQIISSIPSLSSSVMNHSFPIFLCAYVVNKLPEQTDKPFQLLHLTLGIGILQSIKVGAFRAGFTACGAAIPQYNALPLEVHGFNL